MLSIMAAFLLSPAFSQAVGTTMYVAVRSAELRSSSGFFGSTVGNLDLGDAVTVIQDNGKWMEIRAENALSGWIAATSLSPRRVTGETHSATAREIALAGKGFSRDVEAEYRENGLDYSMVDAMENLIISKEELLQFINDGRLSRGE